MKNVANKLFGLAAATALAVTPMGAGAQDAIQPANANASVQAQTVQYVGAENETINDARMLAASASQNKIAIVVWGGNRALQQEAYNAALDLNDMGIRVAFVRAPDHDSSDQEAFMQVYGRAAPRAEGHWSVERLAEVRPDVRSAALQAHQDIFPEQVAAIQPAASLR